MEMMRYLHETGTTREQCAQIVVKNRRNAMFNPLAGHGADLTLDYVMSAPVVSHPLTELDVSPHSDGAVVIVMATGETALALSDSPVWVRGIGWSSDTPGLETRDWGRARYAEQAGNMAYKMAGIRSPRSEVDFVEISDEFSYKELQHLEALRLCGPGSAGFLTAEGETEITGDFPVNPSGGCLGVGSLLECIGGLQDVGVPCRKTRR